MDIQTNFTIQKQIVGIEFKSLNIIKHIDGTVAYILFNLLLDDNTNNQYEIKLAGQEFNDFWLSFDTTSKMFEVLFNKLNETYSLPSDMDNIILNQ